jgi:peptidoglycan hydrolase-like protein with peptidoglycan-binding domain
MIPYRRIFALAIVLLLITGSVAFTAAAQGKKGKTTAKKAASKKRPTRKSTARRSKRRPTRQNPANREVIIAPGPIVPDQIVVIEHGSARPNGETSAAPRPLPRATPEATTQPVNYNISTRRIDVDIDPQRVTEIQQALAEKGFYSGSPSGVYDQVTFEAMRQFQASHQIDVTGYPTAHALKRLGLAN